MTYIDGFVIAVPTARKGEFIEQANKELGWIEWPTRPAAMPR